MDRSAAAETDKLVSRLGRIATLKTYSDLVLAFFWIVVTLVIVLLPTSFGSIARTVIALAFFFLVPSYALVAAMFPNRAKISDFERIMLVLGLGVPIICFVGLLLDYSPLGFQSNAILAILSLFTVCCLAIAALRRRALQTALRYFIDFERLIRLPRITLSRTDGKLDYALTVLLAASIVLSISVLTFAAISPKQDETLTEFYLLGPNGLAGNYPTNFSLGEQKPVIVGIVNHENSEETYNLVVRLNGSQSTTLYSQQITLANNQTKETSINIKPDQSGKNMRLEFLLYLNGSNVPYREDYLWINVT